MAKKRREGALPKRSPRAGNDAVLLRGAAPDSARFVRFRDIGMAALLVGVLLIAYWPALNGGFVWDDGSHATRPELRSLHGLWRIWFDLGATQQYYPLLHSAFWVEHRLWGDAVFGYHITNLLLHAAAVFLVVMILRGLSVPGAWLAGFLFALHPVCVEAVAWISEQKSTLSTVFYLGAALTYLQFDQTRRRSRYFLALGLFVLALLTKTVTATLPAALLVIFWWKRGRLSWKRDAVPLLPWFVAGAGAGLFTAWVERTFIGAEGADFALTLGQRCLLAGRVIWFYLAKLAWPAGLTFIYPRWNVDPAVWWQYLFPLGALALLAGLCLTARRHRGPLAGFLFFAGALFPAMGFFNVYPFRYSYVADHFQYLACLGILAPLAAGMALAVARIPAGARQPARALCGVLLLTLGLLSWQQSGIYQDADTLYQATLARNPDCWLAHNNLGSDIMQTPGHLPEAIAHFQTALRLKPDYALAHNNLGTAWLRSGRLSDAIAEYQTALRIKPDYAQAHCNLGVALYKAGRLAQVIPEFQAALRIEPDYAEAHLNLGIALLKDGRLPEAVSEFQAAVRFEPDLAEAHDKLGLALLKMGRAPQAISELQAALQITPDSPEGHFNLAYALSTMGRLPEAISEYQAAVNLDPYYVEAHNNLGNALSSAGRIPEAISEYEAVLRIRPDSERLRQLVENLRTAQNRKSRSADPR